MKKVLFIGAAGYIATASTQCFLDRNYEVVGLDALVYGNDKSIEPYFSAPNYRFVGADFLDFEKTDEALEGVDSVIIFAGLVGDPITKQYPELSEHINTQGLKQLIEQLNGRGLEKVIFISTCSNYGLIESDELAKETHELKPLSLYAKAKVEIEHYLMAQRGKIDYCPTVLRFATAFGLSPRMRFDLTVNEFVRDLYLGKELVVYDHETWRPYCHVLDFAQALDLVLRAPAEKVAYEVFNAGSDENNYTKQMVVEAVCQYLPGAKVTYQEHGSDPRNYKVDFSKIKETLGFKPAYLVSDGVQEILKALQAGRFDDVEQNKSFYGNYTVNYAPLYEEA